MLSVCLVIAQLVKFGIILSQPNSEGFIHWFYGFHNYVPYSFNNTYEGNGMRVPFPVPYSMLWYSYYEITSFGYWTFNFVTFSIDCALLWVVSRNHSQFYTAYVLQMSFQFLLVSPQDFLIFVFIVIGRVKPFFLPLAIATKFPLIPPILDPKIWVFIFTNPYSIHDPLNYARYAYIGIAWMTSLLLWLSDRGTLTKLYRHGRVNISDNSVRVSV